MGKILTAFLLLFSLFTALSMADITSVKIRSHNRDIIRFSKFEFSHTGYVSVAVSSVRISSIPLTSNSSQPDPSRTGFFLLPDELSYRYLLEFRRNPDLCSLDIKFISVLFTFRDLSPPPYSSFNKSYHVIYPGVYSLFFVNCNDLSLVTMDVRTELYNTDNDDTIKDYLSAEQSQPSFYFNCFIIYACILGLWIMLFFFFKNQNRSKRIHLLMGVLLVVTLIHLICAAVNQNDLKLTGSHRHGWHVLYCTSQFMRNVFFFTVIVMIGAGWCNGRRFFPEIIVLTIVILLQVCATVSNIVGEESSLYYEKQNLKAMYIVIDIISCLVVFFHNICSYCWDYEDLTVVLDKIVLGSVISAILIVFREVTEETGNLVFTMVIMFCMYRPSVLDGKDQKGAGILLKDKDKKVSTHRGRI